MNTEMSSMLSEKENTLLNMEMKKEVKVKNVGTSRYSSRHLDGYF